MRLRRRSIRTLGAVLLSGSLLGVGPAAFDTGTVAQAYTRHCRSNHHHGSYVCFQPYGDNFYVKDTRPDGYSAAAHDEMFGGHSTGVCINSRGYGKRKTCDFDLPDDRDINFWAVNIDSPTWTWRHWSAMRDSRT
jgi:hypothetical protein